MNQTDTHWIERKVYLNAEMYGTVDFAAIIDDGEHLHVVDLKYGVGVQVFADTMQGKYYAAAILQELDLDTFRKLKYVTVTICQPRINNTNSETFKVKEICAAYDELMAGRKKVEKQDRHFAKGNFEKMQFKVGTWCGFCKAKRQCRAMHDYIIRKGPMKLAWLEFAKGQPVGTRRDDFVFDKIGLLTKEELADYFVWCDLAVRTGNAVKDRLTSHAAKGEKIPGLKLVKGRRSRKWKDDKEAEKFLRESKVLPFAPPKLLSVAQADEALDVPGYLIDESLTKPSLVVESDARPEMLPEKADLSGFDEFL